QVSALGATEVRSMSGEEFAKWRRDIVTFDDVTRRRTLHLAYEHHFYQHTLRSLGTHIRQSFKLPKRPAYQAIFCLDEREESLRRHLEETNFRSETYGVAGFFNVDVLFQEAGAQEAVPVCPAAVVPKHVVKERWRAPRHRTPS